MSQHNENDHVTVGRYVDGQMTGSERNAFEERLRGDPVLCETLAQSEGLRAVFAVSRSEPVPPLRQGFADRVLARLQRGDSGDARVELERRVVRVARACVLAAAAVLVTAVLLATGVLRRPDSGRLQADSGVELIRALDAAIQAADGRLQPSGR